MKTTKQFIDLAASNKEDVSDKAISHLASKAKHLHRVEDPTGKRPYGIMVPSGEVSLVTIPKSIRRKMEKSSKIVIPERTTIITHALPDTPSSVGGSKQKPLNKGDYLAEIKDQYQEHKNKYHKKKEK